jgi:hypothetical protein
MDYFHKVDVNRFLIHAEKQAIERKLGRSRIEATVLAPDWTEADPDPGLTRPYKATPEIGNRVLRVVPGTVG